MGFLKDLLDQPAPDVPEIPAVAAIQMILGQLPTEFRKLGDAAFSFVVSEGVIKYQQLKDLGHWFGTQLVDVEPVAVDNTCPEGTCGGIETTLVYTIFSVTANMPNFPA